MSSSYQGAFKGPYAGNFIAEDALGGGGGGRLLTPASWSIYAGWDVSAGQGSYSGDFTNPVDEYLLEGIYASNSYVYIETEPLGPQKSGTTIYAGFEGYNGGALITCVGLGSGHGWRGGVTSALRIYLAANVGVAVPVVLSATP